MHSKLHAARVLLAAQGKAKGSPQSLCFACKCLPIFWFSSYTSLQTISNCVQRLHITSLHTISVMQVSASHLHCNSSIPRCFWEKSTVIFEDIQHSSHNAITISAFRSKIVCGKVWPDLNECAQDTMFNNGVSLQPRYSPLFSKCMETIVCYSEEWIFCSKTNSSTCEIASLECTIYPSYRKLDGGTWKECCFIQTIASKHMILLEGF